MRIGSLFSGAGGLDMAVEHIFSGTTVWHVENDPAASKVLAHRWPDTPNLGDITQVDWEWVEDVDVLCGGFPCQDISSAGKRAGMGHGTRSGLWSQFARAIDELRPPLMVIENVRNLLSVEALRAMESPQDVVGDGQFEPVLRGLGAVLGDLADLGYDAQWATVSAASVGAPHRRERVFILATDASRERHGDQQDDRLVGQLDSGASGETRQQQRTWPFTGPGGLPAADTSGDGRDEGRPEPTRLIGRSDAAVGSDGPVDLLPTPQAHDGTGGAKTPEQIAQDSHQPANLNETAQNILGHQTGWGKYEPAIRRWESVTRPAPPPTEPNKNGNPRLSAAFSEWLMGWPPGHVTNTPGISRNDALRIIGNGVIPQQAHAAIQWLLSVSEAAA